MVTNAETRVRNLFLSRMGYGTLSWDADLVFSCSSIEGNPLYLHGPAVLFCEQSTPGNATGSWYTFASVSVNFNRRLGSISTTFPQCIRKYHAYFFYTNTICKISVLMSAF